MIARYGGGWRGIKPKVAGEHGAIGCIIYSDPRGDGYFHGDDYPTGGWRPRDGVQRGSVMDTEYPGDPLTPGVGATADAKRLSVKEAPTITKIPVLPISYADALPLLSALKGPVAPENWRGALAITYHVGPGPAKVHLKVVSNWDIKPIYDVIGTLQGADDGQWVIRGNHHDAWVNGADDPISGRAPCWKKHECSASCIARDGIRSGPSSIARGMEKNRDLLGSVEWVETHLDELQNMPSLTSIPTATRRGYFFPGGTQDLQTFISGVARDMQDPETHMSVFQRSHLVSISRAKDADERDDLRKRNDLVVHALGDGSDFTAFQDLAGISTLSVEFGGEDDGDQYHSIYDDFYWYTHFIDTDFVYGRALAQTAGTAMMRLADVELIPFDILRKQKRSPNTKQSSKSC